MGSLLLLMLLALPAPVRAEVADTTPAALEGIGIDQNLDAQVPAGLPFVDEAGKPVTLSSYLGKKPAVLVLAYYECPRLCTLVLNGVADALSKASLVPGKDYDLIAVSINPKDSPALAAVKKASYVARYSRAHGEGWHFLTGPQDSITRLASAVGFHYRYDPATRGFVHASGIMVLTPGGRISHYFYGIQYPPRDLRLSLVEASGGKIGTAVDKVLLFCCSIDLTTGKYTASIFRIIQVLGTGLVLLLGGWLYLLFRDDRRKLA